MSACGNSYIGEELLRKLGLLFDGDIFDVSRENFSPSHRLERAVLKVEHLHALQGFVNEVNVPQRLQT